MCLTVSRNCLEDYFDKIYCTCFKGQIQLFYIYFAQTKLFDAKVVGRLFKFNKLGNICGV